ncbi:hypothetical protein SAMN05444422_101568 [Halobiforma haloterrestris]|uniref:Uncharacterized protein n=1 Tax=Natronobacterium haloterrestre TaxID=148448 RepID=A0A1I1DG41_NATHA|nr:hypothetical protein [Halobiforma haloterrestris]SFB73342.1 hypothetical protein SAMN05444422_101568 [Halobiforma haloterrestris]
MTEDHDHDHDYDAIPDVSSDTPSPIGDIDAAEPIDTVASAALGDRIPRGANAAAAAGGGLLLLSALRSLGRGQLRAIPKAAGGAGLLAYGLGRAGERGESESGSGTFEPDLDDVDDGTDGKEVSDQAHAAGTRPDHGRGPRSESDSLANEDSDAGTDVEFTDDEGAEPRSRPGGDEGLDPRRTEDDESVEIDVSDSAMADEASEATGPDPEQAQPAQTDAIEPEETPDEDASHMKVEPDDESESNGNDREEASEDWTDGEDGEDEADAEDA